MRGAWSHNNLISHPYLMSTTPTATPRLTVRTAKTPQELLMALLALSFSAIEAVENQVVRARAIIGNAQLLPAQTANGMKGRLVVSTTAIVNAQEFALAFKAFQAQIMSNAFATVELARQAFYDLSDKYTVRAIIWEDTPNFREITDYGEIKGILRLSGVYTTKEGVSKQSWELIKVSSALVVSEGKAFKLGSFDAAIVDNSGAAAPSPTATPPVPTPEPAMAAPAPTAPAMKLVNGQQFAPEALLASGWNQAQIDALPNA